MKKYLQNLPKEIQDLIYLSREIASKNNMSIYIVGGFVRDLILGVNNFDLDFVVEGDGIVFAQNLSEVLKARVICHRRFGTATVILKNNLKIDIATSRRENYPYPASLPQVTAGSLRDDLARRDFTINAMAVDITKRNFGKLIDFFKGEDDLLDKKIRVLHILSFIDDPTRILRAIRFEKRYGFRIEPSTLNLLKEAVWLKMMEKVHPQRLRDELILILKEAKPLKPLRRTQELVGFKFIHPHLRLTKSTYKLLNSIQDEFNWFKKNYPKRRHLDTWLIFFLGLTDSLNIDDTQDVCKKFVFSKGDKKRILSYKQISHKFILELKRPNIKPSKIFACLNPLSYEVIILLKAKYANRNIQRYIEDFFEIYNGMYILISGDDLKRLGIRPGPYYQKIFAKVLKAKLEGKVRTRQEELALIGKLIK